MNKQFKKQSIWKIILLMLISAVVITSCTQQSDTTTLTDEDARLIVIDAVDNFRLLQSFRFNIVQGGTPYPFIFQLGPGQPQLETTMSSAEAAFIAPDKLYANARISIQTLLVSVGLFAEQDNQWLSPLNTAWIPFAFAEDFNPDSLMGADSGFTSAISSLTNVRYIETIQRDDSDIIHASGDATSDVVNELLFGLVDLDAERTEVDIFIDRTLNLPTQIILTIPDTAADGEDDTFWGIEIYDGNAIFEVDAPTGVDTTITLPEEVPLTSVTWLTPLLWLMGLSSILGAVVTPFIYQRKGRSPSNAVVIGGLVGAIGSLVLLIPLWLLIPKMDAIDTSDNESIRYTPLTNINPWIVIGFIAIPVFVGSLDLTVVSAFLPELVTDLGLPFETGLDDASWVVTAYLLAYTVSLTFTGRLSDLLGRRMVYVASLLVFIIGSTWVAVALSVPKDWLTNLYLTLGQRPNDSYVGLQAIIIGRTIQAIGAGALVPVSLALVGDIFPPDKRARPLGFVAAMDTLGWVLGPVYGGVFMQIMPWQGLFWMNVPLTFFALFSILYALRNLTMVKVRGVFDLLGTVLIVGSLSAMSIGLGANIDPTGGAVRVEDLQPLPDYALPLLALAVILLVGFILVESKVKDPLVNLKMFTRRNLSAASLVNLLVGYCLFIGLVSVPILVNLQSDANSFSDAALQVGAMLSTLTLPMAFAAVPGGWMSDRIGVKQTILVGLILSIIGFTAIWLTWTVDISSVVVGIEMAIVGVGIGLTFSPVSAAIINSAKDSERGVAGAIVLILRLIGMTVSISTLSSVMFYRINAMVAEATAGITTLDLGAFNTAYTVSSVQVLGEMGLIGAVLSAIAIIPALFIDKTIEMPEGD
ncbi:MAG: MFS transporter [Phototrophicaceae bacterium]